MTGPMIQMTIMKRTMNNEHTEEIDDYSSRSKANFTWLVYAAKNFCILPLQGRRKFIFYFSVRFCTSNNNFKDLPVHFESFIFYHAQHVFAVEERAIFNVHSESQSSLLF